MKVRPATPEDLDVLAKIWYDGWQDAHADILPAELGRDRTVENLRERLISMISDVRVVGEVGTPLGFSLTKDDELNQFYVTAAARGTGVAKDLIEEAEQRLASQGYKTAWLACAIGNNRAARFYEKSGWHLSRTFTSEIKLSDGILNLEVWRYEKNL